MSVLVAGSAAAARLAFLADDTDVGDETHKAGPIAILVIAILCIGCFILFRSMSRHLRRVRDGFPEQLDDGELDDGQLDDGQMGDGPTAAAPARPVAGPTATSSTASAPRAVTVSRGTPKTRPRTTDDSGVR